MDAQLLQQDDSLLVQDLFLTKVVLLVAADAPIEEWSFEIDRFQADSGPEWLRNAFLLDYTFARCIAAISPMASQEATTGNRRRALEFMTAFLAAIRVNNSAAAARIWDAANDTHSLTTHQDAHPVLLIELLSQLPTPGASAALTRLAPPYDPHRQLRLPNLP